MAICLRWGGIFNDIFIANFQENVTVKEFWKLDSIWRSVDYIGLLFWPTLYTQCNNWEMQRFVYGRPKFQSATFQNAFIVNGVYILLCPWVHVALYLHPLIPPSGSAPAPTSQIWMSRIASFKRRRILSLCAYVFLRVLCWPRQTDGRTSDSIYSALTEHSPICCRALITELLDSETAAIH